MFLYNNHAYAHWNGAWYGENVIKTANGKYWGFPVCRELTYAEWKQKLADAFNQKRPANVDAITAANIPPVMGATTSRTARGPRTRTRSMSTTSIIGGSPSRSSIIAPPADRPHEHRNNEQNER